MATQDTILSVLATLLQMPLPFSLRGRNASTQRWVGARPWLRYPLKSEEFVRRSQDAVTWSTKRGVGYGVFPYQVEE